MLGSRVCWQLLLGCALLLGQPVFGDSNTTQEPVPVSQASEESGSVSQESGSESVSSESESGSSSEELAPVPEQPELPVTDKSEKRELTSDEKLEKDEHEEREWLQKQVPKPWNFEIQKMQRTVLAHHHKHSQEYYRTFENANLRTQKAIGTMIDLQMTVVKTNCTNDQQPKEEESDDHYYYRLYHSDRYPRKCEPLSDSDKQECRVTFFEDARNPGEPVIIDHRCNPFHGQHAYDFPYELLEYK